MEHNYDERDDEADWQPAVMRRGPEREEKKEEDERRRVRRA